jgi:hypothetical protein
MQLSPHVNMVTRMHLTAEEVAGICRDSARVWTSRYHGFVLSRAAGQQDVRVVAPGYKLAVEEPPQDRRAARRHVDVLRTELGLPVIETIHSSSSTLHES